MDEKNIMMKNVERYNERAAAYDRWYDENPAYFAAELQALRAVLPAGRGLEIGAGSGRFTDALDIAVGLEPAARMRALAKARGVTLDAGFAEALPYGGRTFDYVCFLTSLEFVDDQKTALSEAARVLKSEGRLIVAYLNAESTEGQALVRTRHESPDFAGASFLTPDSLRILLSAAGFKMISSAHVVARHGQYSVVSGSGDGLYTVAAAIRSEAS